ncbi:uncharacterized protein METZ01_LOCUS275830 [marine metagenome]|uniref:Uncharacterized protein n=1 Tax=marine metagenome TaxID=408172 RepID=A0A382KFY1_9ZZZZ
MHKTIHASITTLKLYISIPRIHPAYHNVSFIIDKFITIFKITN